MLVAVAYYIGTEKEYKGSLPLGVLISFLGACVVISEIVAWLKRKKISPAQPDNSNNIISNLIPFTKLNFTFTFSAIVSAIIKFLQRSQVGVPKLSIQAGVMLVCLALANSEAKAHFIKRVASWRGEDLELDRPTRNPREAFQKTVMANNSR